MRKMNGALLIAVTLASGPTWAQPPNEVYSFDVISDTVVSPPSPPGTVCAATVPYHLATLTVTHQAFAPDHAASLFAGPYSPTDNHGVVSFIVSPQVGFFGYLNWPPTSPPPLPPFAPSIDINVQLSGNDVAGSIQDNGPTPSSPHLSMMNGIDEHWIGEFGQFEGAPACVHSFVAVATRVPQGLVSQ